MSGSSIATAIASGLAALILYCMQVAALDSEAPGGWLRQGNGSVTRADFIALKEYGKMKEAMLDIGTSQTNDPSRGKYLEVWRLFEPAVQDEQNGLDRVEIVTKVAGLLKNGGKYNPGRQ